MEAATKRRYPWTIRAWVAHMRKTRHDCYTEQGRKAWKNMEGYHIEEG
jgi:hypothetical protein